MIDGDISRIRTRTKSETPVRYAMRLSFWLGILGVIAVVGDIGFEASFILYGAVHWFYFLALLSGVFFILASHFSKNENPRLKVWLVDAILLLLCLFQIIRLGIWLGDSIPPRHPLLNFTIIAVFARELSHYRVEVKKQYLNPAQLFIISFLAMILTGSLLLMLPKSTDHGISFVDALFTATSAVCVTGLTVVDTGHYFTALGQTIIIILIQAGGLGIMTFTSYFGYFFKGGASYQNRVLIQDMTNAERVADVFSTLKKILLITLFIEFIGAVIIAASLDRSMLPTTGERVFFSVFHAVSAFCNAGFSTLTDNLYDAGIRFNYSLQLTVAVLIIIGGIGFPILFNALHYLKHLAINNFFQRQRQHVPWLIGINSRIVLITTAILLVAGTGLIYLLEYNNALAEHQGMGKLASAFFSAVTPRTAGFNSIDMSVLHYSTIMITFILMWIGASPGSTGGGIKTSTFAIAVLNFLSIAKGKDRIEIYRREISTMSSRRANAAIILSLIVIGTSVFFLSIFEPGKDMLRLAFESVSAFGTVGLSLGITGSLSTAGKIVIVLTMFIGRVSMLTILVAFMRRIVNLKYKYPVEDVQIN